MIPDEYTEWINERAKNLDLDYNLGDIVVSLLGDRGTLYKATAYECMSDKGNFEKYNKEKHGALSF